MSLVDQVTNLTNDRNNIRTSLINKGITEAADHGFSSFDEDIDRMVKPEGTYTVTENGEYDVTEWQGLIVNVYTVVPLESPEADADTYQVSIVLTWNVIPNAISYTVERKHGTDGEWSTIYVVRDGSTNEYKDSNIILGDQYYYRVYAISDGTLYGNSLSSNVVSITAPTGGGFIDVFKNNDYCESVSGGWEIGGFNTTSIVPHDAPITSDGYLRFAYENYGSNVWMHTKNTINLTGNYDDGMDIVAINIKKVSTYAENMEFGLFSKDDISIYYALYSPPSSFVNGLFKIKDNGTASTGLHGGYTIEDIPSGEYYIGVRCQSTHAEEIQISYCKISKVLWDGILLNKPNDFEVTDITGGYIGLDAPHYKPYLYPEVTPVKEIKDVGETTLFFSPPSGAPSNYCFAFMTNKKIDFGGTSRLAIREYALNASGDRRILFLDDNYRVIERVQASVPSSLRYTYVDIPERIQGGGSFYLEFVLTNSGWYGMRDMYLQEF